MVLTRSGVEGLKESREHYSTPVLMLTAKGDTIDRVVGLEIGADDYLPKPCDPRELVSRVRAVLRRAAPNIPTGSSPERLTVENISLHRGSRTTTWQDIEVPLTGDRKSVV